jgi:hypothetical protein
MSTQPTFSQGDAVKILIDDEGCMGKIARVSEVRRNVIPISPTSLLPEIVYYTYKVRGRSYTQKELEAASMPQVKVDLPEEWTWNAPKFSFGQQVYIRDYSEPLFVQGMVKQGSYSLQPDGYWMYLLASEANHFCSYADRQSWFDEEEISAALWPEDQDSEEE